MTKPALVTAPAELFRVARADDPWRPSVIDPADVAMERAGNRWDVPGKGVTYFASNRAGCYAETLARFRPTTAIRAAVKDEDPTFMMVGGVPADWRHRRVVGSASLQNPLPFIDVEEPSTHEHLTTQLAATLGALGVDLVDVGIVRGRNRLITRAIAQWVFDATDDAGDYLYSGIRYMSRLGAWECWAVFDGVLMYEQSRRTIDVEDPELIAVADQFDLRVY